MFGWFERLPDEAYLEWVFKTYRWLLQNFGGWREFQKRQLILPTRDFYPTLTCAGGEFATRYFDLTRKYAGLSHWPCRLESNPKSYLKTAEKHLAKNRPEELAILRNVKATREWP